MDCRAYPWTDVRILKLELETVEVVFGFIGYPRFYSLVQSIAAIHGCAYRELYPITINQP
jgi:energy-converting hydrogenase Eha subunit E